MLCAAAALLTSACGDGTGPGLHPSSYELVQVSGQPLPYVDYTGGFGSTRCVGRLTWRRLDFTSSGRYTRTSESVLSCDDGRPDYATHFRDGGTYTVSGDTVVMLADVPPGGGEAIPAKAVRSGVELRQDEVSYLGSGYGDYILDVQTYVYRAVP